MPAEICLKFKSWLPNGECFTDLGIYNEDAPTVLMNTVLQKAFETHENYDAVIANGDFVGHGYALDNADQGDHR